MGWVIEWVGYKIFIEKEISDDITIKNKSAKVFNIHRCVAISVEMIPKVLSEAFIMHFFPLNFHIQKELEGEKVQKSLELMCFFLVVEN